MNRRSFLRGCCGGLAGLIVGCEPVLAQSSRGGIVKEPCPCLLEPDGPPVRNILVAGCTIGAGDLLVLDPDGYVRPMRDWDIDCIGVAAVPIEQGMTIMASAAAEPLAAPVQKSSLARHSTAMLAKCS